MVLVATIVGHSLYTKMSTKDMLYEDSCLFCLNWYESLDVYCLHSIAQFSWTAQYCKEKYYCLQWISAINALLTLP